MREAKHVLTILAVRDLARAARFYDRAFGWPRAVDAPVYVEYQLPGGARLGVYQREAFGKNTGRVPLEAPADGGLLPNELYFHVADADAVDEASARLVDAGAALLSSRAARPWGDEAAYHRDPDGNVLVVACPAPASPAKAPAASGAFHEDFYRHAELYDIAFDFRDVAREVDWLDRVAEEALGRRPASFLELGAGPAAHAREQARRGRRAVALDLAPGMVAYGAACARAAGLDLDYRRGDMTGFRLEEPVDQAALLMDSASYLLDNDAVLRHLACVADALVEGGLYVLEMSHPRDVFRVGRSTCADWEMTRCATTVHVQWGAPGDRFDPTTQVTDTTVTVRASVEGREQTFTDRAPQRSFSPNELRALVVASGRFDLVRLQGSLDPSVPFDDAGRAWRMVPVLRRRRGSACGT